MTQKNSGKTKITRPLSLFLAVILLVIAPGIPSYADTALSNDTDNPSVTPQEDSLPANPVHHCTYNGNKENTANWEKDAATWSYIYFGSYPQTEVTDAATMAAIDNAIAQKRGVRKSCTDVWVNNTKYRRILAGKFAGYIEDTYRYFKWQPIKWKVLDNNDNGALFVQAVRALDCIQYFDNLNFPDTTTYSWEISSIRSWLNRSFYRDAFSKEEQNAICAWNVINNEKNPYCDTNGGKDTTDKVYLLSIKEATNARYGFCDIDGSSLSRQTRPSAYAHARGALKDTDPMYGCCTLWWLRSIGWNKDDNEDTPSAALIDQYGSVYNGYTYDGQGVAPAIHIQASSSLWSPAEPDNDAKTEVAGIEIGVPSYELAAGKSVKLSVDIEPKTAVNKNVIWVTSNSKYATVDKNNKLTLKKAGAGKSVDITAIAADGSGTTSGYGCEITIMKHAVKRIKLSASSKTVKAGKSVKIKATVKTTGKNANTTLKWTSSNKKYATVTDTGKVKAKKAGKNKRVTITARATDGTNKKAKIKLKIK